MSNLPKKYDETFKKNIVTLHQNGKTQTQLAKEYGISITAIGRWVKQYSEIKIDDDTVMTAKQIKELQKRNAILEEENLILKKRLPYSRHTQTTTECCSYTSVSASYQDPLPCPSRQSQHLLQAFSPYPGSTYSGKPGNSFRNSGTVRQIR